MNKIYMTSEYNTAAKNALLLILRIGVSLMMLTHGLPKLEMLLNGGEVQFPSILGMSGELSLVLAIFAEVVCSLLLLLGLLTRWASIPLIITMGIAVLVVHLNDPFSNKEIGLLYLLIYLVLLVFGSGRFSLDHLLTKMKK